MVGDPAGYEYDYDYENRLIGISQGGATIVEYAYDALGRRIEKYDPAAGGSGETTRYYYDGWRVLSEHDGDDANQAMLRYFVYGNYIDEVVMMRYDVGVWTSQLSW